MATLRHGTAGHPRPVPSRQLAETGASAWWHELVWVGGAAVVGFATTAVFADWLEVSRSWLVLVYSAVVVPLFAAYVRWNHIDLRGAVARHWRWGIAAGVVAGALLVTAVQREDGGTRPEGIQLAWDVVWLGFVYGFVDALLLNVLPVMATWRAFSRRGWTERWEGKIGVGALAVVASLLVTAAFTVLATRSSKEPEVRDPLVGNTIITLSTVVSGSPIGAVVSHIAMHVAAVFHGAEGRRNCRRITRQDMPPHGRGEGAPARRRLLGFCSVRETPRQRQVRGVMFWLTRNRFAGSYVALIARSRS